MIRLKSINSENWVLPTIVLAAMIAYTILASVYYNNEAST